MKPKGEEDEEGVPQISRPGDPEKQALGIFVVGLQVVGAAHPETLHGVHRGIKHLSVKRKKSQSSDVRVEERRVLLSARQLAVFIVDGPTTQTHAHADLWTLRMCNKRLAVTRVWEACHTNKLGR